MPNQKEASMLALSDTEMLACKVLLAAAHCRIPVEDMRREMRCERIPEQTWRPLWEILGLMVLVDDHDSEFVTFTENVVAFIPRSKPSRRHATWSHNAPGAA
jgi:hypothetical protein